MTKVVEIPVVDGASVSVTYFADDPQRVLDMVRVLGAHLCEHHYEAMDDMAESWIVAVTWRHGDVPCSMQSGRTFAPTLVATP